MQTIENKITNEEIKLFNQHFKIRQTYAIEYLEEVPELTYDFQQNKYMEDLGFYDENFNSTVISDSGRYYIYSKSSGEEYLIDDISDITAFIQGKMPQILKEETLYERNKPQQIIFTNLKNKNTKDYRPVTQI